jgi:hypothetical protein
MMLVSLGMGERRHMCLNKAAALQRLLRAFHEQLSVQVINILIPFMGLKMRHPT